jgi:hypothetical protein
MLQLREQRDYLRVKVLDLGFGAYLGFGSIEIWDLINI